ncbi:MAG TPA: alpha-glucan family phosphorylase [Deltaproteobacteria bacterium]|nr:alpha-glucan family phosphorylase [Deltaproteobacteria bacterium]
MDAFLSQDPRRLLPTIAYFSMEIGLNSEIHTYSGGLGILAGDTLRAAADNGLPMVGMTLLYRKGYFRQEINAEGYQVEHPNPWDPEKYLERMEPKVKIQIEGREVWISAWRYRVQGIGEASTFVYFLDTDLPENGEFDRTLTDFLYGGDNFYRLCQEAVLGLGGIAMLRALGIRPIHPYHMNEGHSALLTLALLEEQVGERGLAAATDEDREKVREQCVFTTHTPVPAGHDQFDIETARRVLGNERCAALENSGCCFQGMINMTRIALTFSHYINGVAMRHGEISQDMFPHYPIDSITNGVQAAMWVAPPFATLYDKHLPGWKRDNLYLRHALGIPIEEIRQTHRLCKAELFEEVQKRVGVSLDPEVFTIGFARRMTGYKRPDLLLCDPERLRHIAAQAGAFQVLYAGKAHPRDESGKNLIHFIHQTAKSLEAQVRILFLPDYDISLAKRLVSGVDLWLNTPQKPQEASGTSGMKAALNGIPSLSVLDGWWIEGHLEGVTGWAVGDHWEGESAAGEDIASLYDKLEKIILPLFYGQTQQYGEIMRATIAHNGSFFNTQRMMVQYLKNAYLEF